MGLVEQKEASNKKQLELLPDHIENVQLKVKDEVIECGFTKVVRERPQKFGGGKSVHYAIDEVPGMFPQGSIRINVPFYGIKGHTPTEEQLRTLWETGQVRVDDNVSQKGNAYSRIYKFAADQQDEYGKKGNYFGVLSAEFPPREEK